LKLRRILTLVFVVFLVATLVFSFSGCGKVAVPSGNNQSHNNSTSGNSSNVSTTTASCPPDKGIVIFGTEGCPHCRALKRYSHEVFGSKGTCFVEVNPAYGATKDAQTFFVKIYKEAYPGISENQMGVPLAFFFYGGNVRGVFVGEVGTKTLVSLENFISTSTKSVIVWNGQAYQMSATQATLLTKDIKGFFDKHK